MIRWLKFHLLAFLFSGTADSFAGAHQASVTITRIVVNANQTELQWQGGAAPYRIQWRESLASGAWADVGGAVTATNRLSIVNSSNAFFRVVADGTLPDQSARYRVTFDATWSPETHPTQFPSGAHFSGLIGGTHDARFTMWAPGTVATPGIEVMAETGGRSTLAAEVSAAIAAGTAQYVVQGSSPSSPGTYSLEFDITSSFPLLSLVSMIAPSPDWFVGVRDLDLCPNGQWVEQLVIPLQPYDAGTDSGVTYGSFNADTVPKEPVSQITGFPFEVGGSVPPLGTFTFQRMED